MNELNIALMAVGGLVLILGLLSDFLRRTWWASDPMMALLFGVLLGPVGLAWLDPSSWGIAQEVLLEQAARFTLAIGLMGVALRLPKNYIFRHWQPLAVLLGLVMPLMWLASSFLVYFIMGIPFWEAMLVGAVITPTDPVVATSIVTGVVAKRYLPERLRHLISAESGANDGLAYPIVFLPLLLLKRPPGDALFHWVIRSIAWEVGMAVVVGAVLGYAAGRLLDWAEEKKTIEEKSFLGYTIALSLLVLGAAKLLGSDGILAVFVAGLMLSETIGGNERAEEENIQEAINRFFSLPIFILLGLTISWQDWAAWGWSGPILVVAVLLLRRLPAIFLVNRWIRPLQNLPETLFMGWFGPIGVAAMYYANLAMRETQVDQVWPIASLIICASIFAHGWTATPGSRTYGRWHQKHATGQADGRGRSQ